MFEELLNSLYRKDSKYKKIGTLTDKELVEYETLKCEYEAIAKMERKMKARTKQFWLAIELKHDVVDEYLIIEGNELKRVIHDAN